MFKKRIVIFFMLAATLAVDHKQATYTITKSIRKSSPAATRYRVEDNSKKRIGVLDIVCGNTQSAVHFSGLNNSGGTDEITVTPWGSFNAVNPPGKDPDKFHFAVSDVIKSSKDLGQEPKYNDLWPSVLCSNVDRPNEINVRKTLQSRFKAIVVYKQ